MKSISSDSDEGLKLNCPNCQIANPEGAKFFHIST